MLLQPRNFFYKRKQKKRSLLSFNNHINKNLLNFGGTGLMLLRPIHLTAKQIFRFKLFLKRAMKKSEKTRRCVWFFAFPHLPLTKKSNGVRMGKGKGKLECWFTNISGGTILIEFKNLRPGRSTLFIKQMTHKLGILTKKITFSKNYINFPLNNANNVIFKTFW